MNNEDFFAKLAHNGTTDRVDETAEEMRNETEATLVRSKSLAVPDADQAEERIIHDLAVKSDRILDEDNESGVVLDDAEGHLTIDVYQTSDAIIIESAIAGITIDDLDISISPESVSIKGKRERKERIKKEHYLHQECFWGSFSRSIILPQEIDPDAATASYKNGVLKIVLPKITQQKNRKVRVHID